MVISWVGVFSNFYSPNQRSIDRMSVQANCFGGDEEQVVYGDIEKEGPGLIPERRHFLGVVFVF